MLRYATRLLIAILIIALGYIVAEHVLPHLGLRIGWEAGIFLQGITVVIGWVIGGVICFPIVVKIWRLLRHSATERRVGNYAILVASVAIVLIAFAFLCLVLMSLIGPWV